MKNKILVFAGSARKDSVNKKLARFAAKQLENQAGQVTFIDLADYPLPIYDGDQEALEFPENAKKLHALFKSHQALLIAAPEYNSSVTPLLKNVIDWVSRGFDQEPSMSAYKGKVAGLISASPGALGGLRGLVHLRSILGNIGVLVIPEQVALGNAFEAFNEQGDLKDEGSVKRLNSLTSSLLSVSQKLN
jgi:NAD(P)H-dependent FMN reductase